MGENILRCGSCGAENPTDNKFCGMCGRSLLAMPAQPAPTRTESASAAKQSVPAPGPADLVEHQPPRIVEEPTPAPAYTGGLFRMGAETDRPSRNLDYLLEDDEPKPHRGMFIGLGLVALLLAAGLGYLRFRNGALPSLFSGAKPAHEAPAPETAAGSNPSDASAKDGAASSPDDATPANTVTAPAPTPATAPTEVAPAPDNKQLAEVRPKNPAEAVPPAAIAPAAATSPTPEVAPPPDAKPAPVAKPKPAPKPEDPVTMGEKYIYGRGVTQDCGRGLKTIKPAADQSNARAMITMGALYATGHCVGKDLPTAYRFFALALRKDPENAALKQNVERVWGQMTQSERQQAIRITQ